MTAPAPARKLTPEAADKLTGGLRDAAAEIEAARVAEAAALRTAQRMVRHAAKRGLSERAISEAVGVNRLTVRAWLGKPRTR